MSKSMYCVGKITGGNITMIVAGDKAINENIKQSNVIRANKRESERDGYITRGIGANKSKENYLLSGLIR